MTISYTGSFGRLLFRWKGSLWKSVWKELCAFLALYYMVRFAYNSLMTDPQRRTFEFVAICFDDYISKMPLTFLLGFYIAAIVKRWWVQFEYVVWPDDFLSAVCHCFEGDDEASRLARHAIARWVNLTSVLVWRDVSPKLRRRFPTMQHVLEAELITRDELALYEAIAVPSCRWWIPLAWTQKLIQARISEGKCAVPISTFTLDLLKEVREKHRRLYMYDWVNMPLVYTQVVALAVYGFFSFCIIGRQFLDEKQRIKYYEVDFYVPVFTIVQFLFYIGWYKVAEDLMRPFGLDDDDLEMSYILDRNLRTSFALVDFLCEQQPVLHKDAFWRLEGEKLATLTLPHTSHSLGDDYRPPKLHSHHHTPAHRLIMEEPTMQAKARRMVSFVPGRPKTDKQLNPF